MLSVESLRNNFLGSLFQATGRETPGRQTEAPLDGGRARAGYAWPGFPYAPGLNPCTTATQIRETRRTAVLTTHTEIRHEKTRPRPAPLPPLFHPPNRPPHPRRPGPRQPIAARRQRNPRRTLPAARRRPGPAHAQQRRLRRRYGACPDRTDDGPLRRPLEPRP